MYLVQSLKEAKMLLKNNFDDFKELLLNYVQLVFATKLEDDDSSLTVFAPVIEEFITSFTGSHEFSKSMTCKEHNVCNETKLMFTLFLHFSVLD